ncbi:MAG TPA: hypothetical protein VLK58_21525 [Conexibacter sp.]|nr:hypothetical protein [Conexibacter sp.]
MQIQVNAQLLRAAAPDLALMPGRSLAARVLERGYANVGMINLAGAIVTAELPEHVQVGDRLRLIVQEATNERLLLQIAPPRESQSLAPSLQPPAPAEAQLPGGRRLAVLERERGGSGDDGAREEEAVTLRVELPALGAVELRIAVDAASARVRVTLPAEAVEQGTQRSQELRAALESRIGRPAEVTVVPRRQPLDIYA